jgi:hypothetical protein
MTRGQVGEEIRSLAVKWLRRLNLWQGDRMTRRQVGEEVRSLPMRWVEEV